MVITIGANYMKNNMYKIGMYGGSFDPLHIGHLHDVIRAASVCEKLYVIISWCLGRESTSRELRYRWLYNSCRHLDNVTILLLEDKAANKEVYNSDYYWQKGANDIKKLIGKKIDAVFCGSDYYGTNRFESLYSKESDIIYFDRSEVPISSTELRFDVYKNWEYIPPICRPYYVKKVLILGGESTGKSTLVKNLSIAYNTNYVREVGRSTCDIAGKEEFMNKEDLIENLLRQKTEEIDAAYNSNKLLFIDTDAITTLFYANILLTDKKEQEDCQKLASAISRINDFDLVLFLEPTVDFVQDGTRNETIRKNRNKYSNQIKKLLRENEVEFISLDGNYLDRFDKTKILIKEKFNIDTIWK
jgi:HTH-type transcriptional repressor of NAD biosynthesis genes